MFSFTEGGWQIYLLMPAMVALSTIWLKTSPIKHCSVAPIYSWRFSLKVLDDAQNGGKCLEGDAAIWEIVPDIVPTIVHDILPWLSPFDIVTSPYLLICHQPSIALNLTFLSSSQLQSIVNPLLSYHHCHCHRDHYPRMFYDTERQCYQGFSSGNPKDADVNDTKDSFSGNPNNFKKSKTSQEIKNVTKDSPAFLRRPITLNVSTISSPESLFSSPSSPVVMIITLMTVVIAMMTLPINVWAI